MGKVYGYYPADALTALKVDSTVDFYTDNIGKIYPVGLAAEDAREGKIAEMVAILPNFFKVLNARLEANTCQKHIVGDKITTADICLANIFLAYAYNEAYPAHTQVLAELENHKSLHAYAEHLKTEFADYLATRPGPRPI